MTGAKTPARRGRTTDWRPDDEAFWRSTGRRTAGRNLLGPVAAEHLGFSVWVMVSIVTPYLAAAGFGGDFASSMANLSYLFSERHRGVALGVNAAGGDIGVSAVRFTGPLLIGLGASRGEAPHLHNIPLPWLVLGLFAAAMAWRGMDDLARTPSRRQPPALASRHTWTMSALCVGTFGSFIDCRRTVFTERIPSLARANAGSARNRRIGALRAA